MAITKLDYSPANVLVAEATAPPRHVWVDRPRAIYVFTGNDIPLDIDPASIVLNRVQLFQGALIVGGQNLLDKFNTYVDTTIPTSGTPAQKIFWKNAQEFPRGIVYTNQLRIAAGITKVEMDNVFKLGSGYTPG
jgi:hypothetical protein